MKVYSEDSFASASGSLEHWLYNGLDCCITSELFSKLEPQLTPEARRVYDFERLKCGPALEMTWRGIQVDRARRLEAVTKTRAQRDRTLSIFERLAHEVTGRIINPRSADQLRSLFYDSLRIEPIITSQKGVKAARMNRETMEKLEFYYYAEPFVKLILHYKDLDKTLQFLNSGIDADGRFRAGFNPIGTETGRWSSGSNPFGTGRNGQNIQPKLRSIFVADDGYKVGSIDLEQAESRGVGAYAYRCTGRPNYWEACEAGDLHTTVARFIWSHITDRDSAEQKFYRDWSYRDMAKRGGHGTNYYGKDYTMARHLKVPVRLITAFQTAYFGEFFEIRGWHDWTRVELSTKHTLTTLVGRTRRFWGWPDDDATLRKAIAFQPQSMIVDVLDMGLLAAWRDPELRMVQWQAQVHDAIYFQYPEKLEDFIIPRILSHLRVSVPVTPILPGYPTRYLVIPAEASSGWNWSKYNPDPKSAFYNPDPDALKKYKGTDSRVRSRPANQDLLAAVI